MKNKKEIASKINNFDYHYEMSDAPNAYYYGRIAEREIVSMLEGLSKRELREVKEMITVSMEAVNLYFKKYFENLETEPLKAITSNVKSKVFKMAWKIFKSDYAVSFSLALKKAWIIIKIGLGRGLKIAYAKSTGELRVATALQVGSITSTVEKGFVKYMENINGSMHWRSFRIERLLTA